MKRISPAIIFIQEAAERKHSPQRGEEEETLPVSVEGARDVERVRTAFVVSSGAKSIHKAAVGKRSLHKETEQRERNKPTMRQVCSFGDGHTGPGPKCVVCVCVCLSVWGHSWKVLTGIVLT